MYPRNRTDSRDNVRHPIKEQFERVDQPKWPDAKQLLQFWHEREAEGGFVVGHDVPSRPLARLLNNLALFEPVRENGAIVDFRARLVGDSAQQVLRRNITGMKLSETYLENQFAARFAVAKGTLNRCVPQIVDVQLDTGSFSSRRWEFVLLPVWNREKTARWLLVGVFQFG